MGRRAKVLTRIMRRDFETLFTAFQHAVVAA